MSESDDVRRLGEALDQLRAPVPVRDEWRAGVLAAVADEPPPHRQARVLRWMRGGRPIVLHPASGIAAALLFAVLGAGAAVGVLALRGARATAVAAGDAPAIEAAAAERVQVVQFVLVAPNASRVSLVGDFNRWNPDASPLRAEGRGGRWSVTVPLEPGRHLYSFVVDGDLMPDPAAPRAAEDDFGAPNSVVVVSGPAT
jgi:hypothetical protein